MAFLPVPGKPFLFSSKEKMLVAADLHIGIEREFAESGVTVPDQRPVLEAGILEAARVVGAKRVLLLGDVKHKVPNISFAEERSVPLFMRRLLEDLEVHVVPGNHDGRLSSLLPKDVVLHPSVGVVFGKTGFFHGHCWPSHGVMGCKTVVMGHVHPSVELRDEIGTGIVMSCWVRTKFLEDKGEAGKKYAVWPEELVVMPAMSTLRRGTPVNVSGMIGPLARSGTLESGSQSLYLLDGTNLGMLAERGGGERRHAL
ncbi:MAG: hypothetical protein QCI38_04510 [Candidatus Thermoplasmatota archaeon]|nr:hypothetical protein [Candidatus Thermoplasmatota archaeon]